MTVSIDIKLELQAELARQAAARVTTIEAYAAQLLEQAVDFPSSKSGGTEPFKTALGDDRPIWEIIVDQMKEIPTEDFATLPRDGASQVDHYIYGTPKRD
jgi:hypothetical protein